MKYLPKWEISILRISFIILIICSLHNILFKFGFFGGSTEASYGYEKVRVLKIRGQKALISKILNNGIIEYSLNKNDRWVTLEDLDFNYSFKNYYSKRNDEFFLK